MPRVHFSESSCPSDRGHFINRADICVVLSRLPNELWQRLRAVHFNDRGFGVRRLGYVAGGRREITLCALPQRLGLSAFCRWNALSPSEFGAQWGAKSPAIAVRRFMLYEVFLHEIGHLQATDRPGRPSQRLRFDGERRAEEFAVTWRRRLWSEYFEHPDAAHNPPPTIAPPRLQGSDCTTKAEPVLDRHTDSSTQIT
ncbi:MAG: hypothetical protein K1X53_00185 [Candidatus Sumerlaeaceae bacterium]|nr:hypothetical protein [Candidatus Sumerlaeaceae bacterium]